MYKTVKKYNLYIIRHKIAFTCINAVLALDLEDCVLLLYLVDKCEDASKTRFRFSILRYFFLFKMPNKYKIHANRYDNANIKNSNKNI